MNSNLAQPKLFAYVVDERSHETITSALHRLAQDKARGAVKHPIMSVSDVEHLAGELQKTLPMDDEETTLD